MCLRAAQFVIDNNRFADFGIPSAAVPFILETWESEPPAIYGRFDICYNGTSPPKLLEYNADTPTALLEASVIQWYWLEDVQKGKDQFNSIHERLIEFWKSLDPPPEGPVHFVSQSGHLEDFMTANYLRD